VRITTPKSAMLPRRTGSPSGCSATTLSVWVALIAFIAIPVALQTATAAAPSTATTAVIHRGDVVRRNVEENAYDRRRRGRAPRLDRSAHQVPASDQDGERHGDQHRRPPRLPGRELRLHQRGHLVHRAEVAHGQRGGAVRVEAGFPVGGLGVAQPVPHLIDHAPAGAGRPQQHPLQPRNVRGHRVEMSADNLGCHV
jgi:hypothetical protein